MISSRWLIVYIFASILASGVWIGTLPTLPFVWLAVVGIGFSLYFYEFPLTVPSEQRPPLRWIDWTAAAILSAPTFAYLLLTWSQEFPYGGDQAYHNGASLEAFAFWWWMPWLAAIAGLSLVVRFRQLAAPALILLAALGAATAPMAFAGRYPGTLHFFAAPFRILPLGSPLNAERLLNALSIPVWLLVLRPLILRRRVDLGSFAAAAFLFWQKDVVYYFTSGYLEPWAIVLLLTAAEHLVRFESEMLWRPLLLLGAAAMIKEHVILSLPVVALFYFPRRERLQYILVVAAAVAPAVLFLFARGSFRTWESAHPVVGAFSASHFAAFAHRIQIEFGLSLPVVLIALGALAILATRRRSFTALLIAAGLDWLLFFTATVMQTWTGYPRTNLVPLAYAAIALGIAIDWLSPRSAAVTIALLAVMNGVVLAPFLRDAKRPDSARNFIEHPDAAIFYPIRQSIERAERAGWISPDQTIALLNNGKWTFFYFYPGPIREQYPDLSSRYRLLVQSFAHTPQRCRCSSDANIALFIRFENLGGSIPQRAAIESEAQQCRQQMLTSCRRTMPIVHEGFLVGFVGSK